MSPVVLTLMIVILTGGNETPQQAPRSAQAARKAPEPPPRPPVLQIQTPPQKLIPFVSASTIFDTNIDHDATDLDSYGVVFGAGGIFKNDPIRPTFEAQYLAGIHQYANTDRWDRISHYVRAAWDRRFTRQVRFEPVAEMSIQGSSEDRDLSNQFVLSPRLEYRFTPELRVRGLVVWRVRRYEDTPDRNAFNRYGGVELLGRPQSGPSWSVGGRYELNATESARQRYLRWTWYGDLSAPVGTRDRLELEVYYRSRHYPFRFVDVRGGPDVLREDVRVEPEVIWLHALDDRRELRIGYAFSGQYSNDVRRDYLSHQLLFGVLNRW
jgi:hypothetical protein